MPVNVNTRRTRRVFESQSSRVSAITRNPELPVRSLLITSKAVPMIFAKHALVEMLAIEDLNAENVKRCLVRGASLGSTSKNAR